MPGDRTGSLSNLAFDRRLRAIHTIASFAGISNSLASTSASSATVVRPSQFCQTRAAERFKQCALFRCRSYTRTSSRNPSTTRSSCRAAGTRCLLPAIMISTSPRPRTSVFALTKSRLCSAGDRRPKPRTHAGPQCIHRVHQMYPNTVPIGQRHRNAELSRRPSPAGLLFPGHIWRFRGGRPGGCGPPRQLQISHVECNLSSNQSLLRRYGLSFLSRFQCPSVR